VGGKNSVVTKTLLECRKIPKKRKKGREKRLDGSLLRSGGGGGGGVQPVRQKKKKKKRGPAGGQKIINGPGKCTINKMLAIAGGECGGGSPMEPTTFGGKRRRGTIQLENKSSDDAISLKYRGKRRRTTGTTFWLKAPRRTNARLPTGRDAPIDEERQIHETGVLSRSQGERQTEQQDTFFNGSRKSKKTRKKGMEAEGGGQGGTTFN